MRTYLNETGVPLSVAVYLASDFYDYIPGAISATGLIKPVRQIVLSKRVPPEQNVTDILNLVQSRTGTSIHDGVEKAWTNNYAKAMQLLGYPQDVIDRIVVNPRELLEQYGYDIDRLIEEGTFLTEGPLPENAIPVFMEIRHVKELNGVPITGKFDFCAEGRVEDVKTTGTFTWIKASKDKDYQLQGSIYRWLNPNLIKQDTMLIQFFFTDWKAHEAKANPNYPQRRTEYKTIPLLSIDDTEEWVRSKLAQIALFENADESYIPECTDEELWREPPVWKYYKNPENTKRATKNFDNPREAHDFMMSKHSGMGVIKEVPGQAKACNYCPAFSVCRQKDRLIAEGSLQPQ